MRKSIDLTEKLLADLKSDDLIAITMAADGAMGDPSLIELVDKDLKIYRTHFGVFDNSKLSKLIPFLDTLRVDLFDNIEGTGDDWAGLYTGCGNYLFVRSELKAPVLHFVEEKVSDTSMPLVVELYAHWYDALVDLDKS